MSYCSILGSHEIENCAPILGGASGFAIVLDTANITDWEDATQWETAKTDGDAIVVADAVMSEVPETSPTETTNINPCKTANIKIGEELVINAQDYSINVNNDGFYARLNKQRNATFVQYLCTGEIRVYEGVDFYASHVIIPNSNKEKQYYSIQVKKYVPAGELGSELYSAPTGIFN
jgi:hypothetical protein